MWRKNSEQIVSKGLIVKKATSLAGLHERRELTQAQFFTPNWVAQKIWDAINQIAVGMKLRVMDNSMGSGRLFTGAIPETAVLYGCDIDTRCVSSLSDDAKAAGFEFHFIATGMETIQAKGMHIGIINPAFSITLSSPYMTHYDCTCYGRFGPNTSALSHIYALEQALDACQAVYAVLPLTMLDHVQDYREYAGYMLLPGDTFINEGANVKTALFFFSKERVAEKYSGELTYENEVPTLSIRNFHTQTIFERVDTDKDEPKITLPVTNNNTVELHHHNKKIVLKFHCGLTQAKVMNTLLIDRVSQPEKSSHRYPNQVTYQGQGRLLLNLYLLQSDPDAAFQRTLDIIREAGGLPIVSATLAKYWQKLKKAYLRGVAPFALTVLANQENKITLKAKRFGLIKGVDEKSIAPVKKDELLLAQLHEGNFIVTKNEVTQEFNKDALLDLFNVESGDISNVAGKAWTKVKEGKNHHFPALATMNYKRFDQLGIDWLWPYQKQDLSEFMIHPTGAIAAWSMGTGKARLATALALCGGKHNLIVVEGGLLPEMKREFDKINLNKNDFKLILKLSDISELKKINLISIETLRKNNAVIAKKCRKMFHTVVVDEGGFLSNTLTLQTKAIQSLSPKKLFILDGTPIPNYVRNLLPLAQLSAGDQAYQPYSRQMHYKAEMLNNMNYCQRGVDAFKDLFVVLDWSTNEFTDNLQTGAKREIPTLKNVASFRQWVGPLLKRRVRNEPDCEPFAGCPDPVINKTVIQWDEEHFNYYIKIASEFSHWFQKTHSECLSNGKRMNFFQVLAKINAVRLAANAPMKHSGNLQSNYNKPTSKMKYVINKTEKLIAGGHKVIIYCQNPDTLDLMHREFGKKQISSTLFHGAISIAKRTKALDSEFRFGSTPILLGSMGVTQRGLNIEQADYVMLYDRDWSGEKQAIERTTRPGQKKIVQVEKVHLAGSIDVYVGQCADFKEATMHAGLDWGDDLSETEKFYHFEAILEQFCKETLGVSQHEIYRKTVNKS